MQVRKYLHNRVCGTNESTIFPEQAVNELDREVENHYTLIVKATEDCLTLPPPISFFNPADDTLLRVHIYVNDINDNPPKFTREVFTGGITTASDFGLEIMRLMVRASTYIKHASCTNC